jgi:hypothetical protein
MHAVEERVSSKIVGMLSPKARLARAQAIYKRNLEVSKHLNVNDPGSPDVRKRGGRGRSSSPDHHYSSSEFGMRSRTMPISVFPMYGDVDGGGGMSPAVTRTGYRTQSDHHHDHHLNQQQQHFQTEGDPLVAAFYAASNQMSAIKKRYASSISSPPPSHLGSSQSQAQRGPALNINNVTIEGLGGISDEGYNPDQHMDLGYLASSEDQKVEMIISLQGEVERLQARLDRDLGDDESPEGQLMRKNTELESENKRLKDE